MSHDIMIDLETLGTTADAVIMSIGAVRFDLESGTVSECEENRFYCSVGIDSQVLHRRISIETIDWWKQQPQKASNIFEEDKVHLTDALYRLRDWAIPPGVASLPITAWSNGADFDLPMLSHAYAWMGFKPAWEPYSARCYRTYKNLPGARTIKVERTGQHHNALDDAIYQARHLCAIHKALFAPVSQEGGAA